MPEPGTPIVRFEDGSGIVVGDGSPEEAEALRALCAEQGDDPEKAEGVARILLDHGLTLATTVPQGTRAWSGESFAALAAFVGARN